MTSRSGPVKSLPRKVTAMLQYSNKTLFSLFRSPCLITFRDRLFDLGEGRGRLKFRVRSPSWHHGGSWSVLGAGFGGVVVEFFLA